MSPFVALALAAIFGSLPFVLVYVCFRLFREKKARKAVERSFDEKADLADKLGKIGKTLLSAKQEADAKVAAIEARFKPVLDLDQEAEVVKTRIANLQAQLSELRTSYTDKKAIYDRLIKEVAIFDEKLAFAEMGVYEPHFDFTDSEEYKSAILRVRDQQKAMVSAKTAVVCPTEWTVEGSRAKGKTLANRSIRLTLRAFNNECDAAIANVRWNNANAMEKRIVNAYIQIDKLNETNTTYIAKQYLASKLEELFLTHEYREKLKQERDEKAEAARLAREEQRLIRDMERAEEDEAKYQRLLDKAKADAERAVGPKLEAFNEQIKMLEKDLAEAHAKFERAQAMAEKTRSGYVYIISNIGSFGEDMIKIGLTRRLDPMDRVRELGDASVPFVFDTHAIIYSDDAPTLERALHNEFEPTRVNTQNYRKEFFRASLDDVEAAVKRLAPSAPFFKDIEAQDYRETLARRHQVLILNEDKQELLPDAI